MVHLTLLSYIQVRFIPLVDKRAGDFTIVFRTFE